MMLFFPFLKRSFILVASVLTNEYNMVDSFCAARDVKAYDRPRISILNSWDTPPFFQDKVYQPLRQRISQTEIYCIMRTEHCELNLYFCFFVFRVRNWSLQSQWQTAAKLMRKEPQPPTEISRWGIMWPTMRVITRLSSFMNSFEAQKFTLISRSGEGKNVFWIIFFFFQSQDDSFYFCHLECCVPGDQFTSG